LIRPRDMKCAAAVIFVSIAAKAGPAI
jgi:hypothetical protein